MTSLRIKHKRYLNPEKSWEISQRRQFCRKCVPKSRTSVSQSSQWCDNSLATGEDCSSLFRILLRVSSAWRWPFSSQDLVTNAGFHMCDNGPLRRTNKMSDMLETNNLDLKSVAMMFICENPLSASAELIGTVCSISNSDARACPTFADFILSKLWNDVNHIHTEPCAQVDNQPFTICPWWWHVWRPRVVVQHIKLIWQTFIVVNYNQPLLEPIYNGL